MTTTTATTATTATSHPPHRARPPDEMAHAYSVRLVSPFSPATTSASRLQAPAPPPSGCAISSSIQSELQYQTKAAFTPHHPPTFLHQQKPRRTDPLSSTPHPVPSRPCRESPALDSACFLSRTNRSFQPTCDLNRPYFLFYFSYSLFLSICSGRRQPLPPVKTLRVTTTTATTHHPTQQFLPHTIPPPYLPLRKRKEGRGKKKKRIQGVDGAQQAGGKLRHAKSERYQESHEPGYRHGEAR